MYDREPYNLDQYTDDMWDSIVCYCETLRQLYLETKDIKYWKELVKDIENNCVLNQCSLIGMDVFKSHPKYGQISKRRLRVLLNGLQKGEYYLIRTERKPNEESKQKEIMNRFGQYKWKTGKIKIVPARTRYTWERLEPYISMFLFKWVEQ